MAIFKYPQNQTFFGYASGFKIEQQLYQVVYFFFGTPGISRETLVPDLSLISYLPMFYCILNIKMTSQSLSNFCIELQAAGE